MSRVRVSLVAVAAVAACRSEPESQRRAVGTPTAVDPGTGVAAGTTGAASCIPVAPHQRPGKATVTARGDGVDISVTDGPAVCGALHTVATRRFAIGDGTLYRACLPDGSSFAISADVELTGHVNPAFKYEDYKKTGPLLELTRPGVGTYNQADPPTDGDKLFIEWDRGSATVSVTTQWPSKPDRRIAITARITCDPPVP